MSDLDEELISKYRHWKSLLERDEINPNHPVSDLLQEIKRIKDQEEDKTFLINNFYQHYTRYLLDKRYFQYQGLDYSTILEFLFESTGLFLKNLSSKDPSGSFESLIRLLDFDKNFYDKHYSPVHYYTEREIKEKVEKKIEKKEEAFFNNHSRSLNVLFNLYINYFNSINGFEVLSDFVKRSSLEQMTQVLYTMVALDEVMQTNPWKRASKLIQKKCISAIADYSEELKLVQKQDLKIFFMNLEKILDKLYTNEKMGKILENLELEMAFKMLQTGILEKRIFGITEIVNKISQAKNLDEDNERRSKGYTVYKSEYRETTKWLTSERLLVWLESKDLVSIIFGPTSHYGIIKQSSDLIRFLYTYSMFSKEQIETLWETAFSKHEAEREALLSLIQDLVAVLDPQDLVFLYSKLKSLSYSFIDSQILQLLKSFSKLGTYSRPSIKKSRNQEQNKEGAWTHNQRPAPLQIEIPSGQSEIPNKRPFSSADNKEGNPISGPSSVAGFVAPPLNLPAQPLSSLPIHSPSNLPTYPLSSLPAPLSNLPVPPSNLPSPPSNLPSPPLNLPIPPSNLPLPPPTQPIHPSFISAPLPFPPSNLPFPPWIHNQANPTQIKCSPSKELTGPEQAKSEEVTNPDQTPLESIKNSECFVTAPANPPFTFLPPTNTPGQLKNFPLPPMPSITPPVPSFPNHILPIYNANPVSFPVCRQKFTPPTIAPILAAKPEQVKFDSSQVLSFIWDLWQESAIEQGMNSDLALQAIAILKDALLNFFRSERLKYLKKCIENIRNSSFVLWSCDLFKSIFESYPSARSQFDVMDSKSSVIKNLEQGLKLTKVLFKSLIEFKQSALDQAISIQGDEPISSSDDEFPLEAKKRNHEELFSGVFLSKDLNLNYLEETKTRLEFLKYIYENSDECLTEWHVKLLWEAFVINATSEKESDLVFSWFINATNSWPNRMMASDELQMFMFRDLLLNLEPSSFTTAAFTCFERFFINVNKQCGLISSMCFDENLEVVSIDLICVEVLWNIMLESKSENVFFLSSGLVKRLYRGLRQCTEEIQKDFIKNCMHHIELVSSSLALVLDEHSVNKISKCLVLISEFIDDFENYSQEPEEINIQIHRKKQHGSATVVSQMRFEKNLTWEKVRDRIKAVFDISPSAQYLFRGQPLGHYNDYKTIEEIGFENNSKVVINTENDEQDENLETPALVDVESLTGLKVIFEHLDEEVLKLALEQCDNQIDEAAAFLTNEENIEKLQEEAQRARPKTSAKAKFRLSNILSNTHEYFTQLFELFSYGNLRINLRIWQLLSKLSVNKKIMEEIKNLENTNDWNHLFDSHCTFRLLYSLQITDEIINQDVFEDWKMKFFNQQGLSHLYNIFIKYKQHDLEPKGPFESKVLDYLIRILASYLKPDCSIAESKSVMDLSLLLSCTVDIVKEALVSTQITEIILARALEFLVIILSYHSNLLKEIYEKRIFVSLISENLLNSSECFIRKTICDTIEGIKSIQVDDIESPKTYFWKIILSSFPEHDNQNCEEFFSLAQAFINDSAEIEISFVSKCVGFVLSRPAIETRQNQNQDKVLTGYLQVIRTSLSYCTISNSSELLMQLYLALFSLESTAESSVDSPPKYKHVETRSAAFDLILKLASISQENSDMLLEKLYAHHSSQKNVSTDASPNYAARVDNEIKPRASSGYVGLRNFGSTCYMNSLMQQIFMMSDVRSGLLKAKICSDIDVNENVLYQMQTLLANLQESEKEYFEPYGFCQAFKSYDGEAINVRVQQDADEFLNLLFDKLEELLKNTESKNLLRDHIGGSFIHEIHSTEAEKPYYGSREEHFFRISLDVKNKKNIQEALDLFVKDDILEGDNKYFCEKYDAKITAKKRCLISSLANTVVIHLKRFEFDYSTMQRFKINDCCEFPVSLNFKNWAKEDDKDSEYYQYELAGIILHSGGADSGHYTSIIKDRQSLKWFKFDDRYVESYCIENLKADCFGGETTVSWGSFSQTKNAYMLIYERKQPRLIENLEESTGFSFTAQIFERIKTENMNFLRDLLYFDRGYFKLLSDFIENYNFKSLLEYREGLSTTRDTKEIIALTRFIEEDQSRACCPRDVLLNSDEVKELLKTVEETEKDDSSLKLIKLGTLFAYETLTRAKNFYYFKLCLGILQDLYLKHIKASIWFLSYLIQNREVISEVLGESRDPEIRSEFSKFISKILQFCSKAEKNILLAKHRVVNLLALPYSEFSGYNHYSLYTVRPQAISARFIELYLNELINDFKRNSSKADDYLSILKDFANSGEEQKIVLIESGCMSELISSLNESNSFTTMDEIEDLFSLLGSLMLNCKTYGMRLSDSYPPHFAQPGINLDSHLENQMTDYYVKKNIIQNIKLEPVERIVIHLVWENLKASNEFLEEFSGHLLGNKFEANKVAGFLKIIQKILVVDDSVKITRVSEFLSSTSIRHIYSIPSRQTFFEQVQRAKDTYCAFAMNIIIWWAELMENSHILEATKSQQSQFRWISQETYYRATYYNFPDYFNRGTSFQVHFENAIRRFREEIDSESDSSSESEGNQYPEAEPKDEEKSTDSENN